MKRTITFLVLLFICAGTAQAQIPNGSFENWTTAGGYSSPDGWDSYNSLTTSYSVYTCEQGTTGAPNGNSFLKLTTKVVGTSAVPGIAMSGKYDFVNSKPKSGFPYTDRPFSLTGKWQYMANGTDTGRIAVYLTKWNTVTGKREMVGGIEYDLPGMVMSWTSFSIPLIYLSGETPDSAVIGLTSSNRTATAGSYLYVDSLNFWGFAAGIPVTTYLKYSVILSPNPAKDHVSVDFGKTVTDNVQLWLMDMYGRVVTEANGDPGKSIYSMDLHTVAQGLYFVRVKAGDEIQTQRLVIQ